MDCNEVFLRNFEIKVSFGIFLSYSLIMDLSITAFFFLIVKLKPLLQDKASRETVGRFVWVV